MEGQQSFFFFFFFFFALAGPWMAAGHFTGADSKKSSLSGATKKKTRISTCSSGVLFNFLRNQMLEITAAPKHLKCCVARSHFCWKCVSSCREEGRGNVGNAGRGSIVALSLSFVLSFLSHSPLRGAHTPGNRGRTFSLEFLDEQSSPLSQ